jgi:hypothetical protein
VYPAHPLGVAPGQVIVDGHHVDALAGEGVEVHRHGGDEGLAFAGLHLGDHVAVQGPGAHHLDVEVALAEHAPGGLAHHGVGLGLDVVERLAFFEAAAELAGLGAQLLVGELLDLRLEGVDLPGQGSELLLHLAFTGGQELLEEGHRPT